MSLSLYHDTFRSISEKPNPPELVLLHGWGMHGLVWDAVMPGLLEHFQVTVVDLPGMGRSPIPGGEYNLDYLVEHVLAIAPEKAVWMGWSLGGMISMRIAALMPSRVSALVTVASSPCFVSNDTWSAAMSPEVLDAFYQMLLEDPEGTLIRFLALQCKGSDTIKEDIRQLKELVNFHGIPARQALRGGLDVLRNVDLRSQLQDIQCPTLHVFGDQDHLVPVGVSGAIGAFQPKAEIAVLKGVSHVPFLSAPELFLSACHDFFSEKGIMT